MKLPHTSKQMQELIKDSIEELYVYPDTFGMSFVCALKPPSLEHLFKGISHVKIHMTYHSMRQVSFDLQALRINPNRWIRRLTPIDPDKPKSVHHYVKFRSFSGAVVGFRYLSKHEAGSFSKNELYWRKK